MASQESLFFLADFSRYKQAKINLLAAKSSILKSRNHIKDIEKKLDNGELSHKKMKKEVKGIKLGISELKSLLPSMKEEIKKKTKQEEALVKKANAQKTEKEKITDEIDDINLKIKELENL